MAVIRETTRIILPNVLFCWWQTTTSGCQTTNKFLKIIPLLCSRHRFSIEKAALYYCGRSGSKLMRNSSELYKNGRLEVKMGGKCKFFEKIVRYLDHSFGFWKSTSIRSMKPQLKVLKTYSGNGALWIDYSNEDCRGLVLISESVSQMEEYVRNNNSTLNAWWLEYLLTGIGSEIFIQWPLVARFGVRLLDIAVE